MNSIDLLLGPGGAAAVASYLGVDEVSTVATLSSETIRFRLRLGSKSRSKEVSLIEFLSKRSPSLTNSEIVTLALVGTAKELRSEAGFDAFDGLVFAPLKVDEHQAWLDYIIKKAAEQLAIVSEPATSRPDPGPAGRFAAIAEEMKEI